MLLEEDYKEAWDIFKEIENKKFFEFMDLSPKRAFFRSKKNNKPITPILISALKNKMEYLSEEEKEIYHLFVYLRYKADQESGVSINAFNRSREYLKKIDSEFYKKSQSYRKHKTNFLCKNSANTPQDDSYENATDFIKGLEVFREELGFSVNKFAGIFKMSSHTYNAYLNNYREIREPTKAKATRRFNESIYSNKEYTVEMIEELGRNKND